jgi:O-antigen ligase
LESAQGNQGSRLMTGIAFFVCFLGGCFLALSRHPIFGVITYVATYYLHPPSRWWGYALPDLRWSLLSAFVCLVAVLIHKKTLLGPPSRTRGPLLIGFCTFIAWLAVQSLWALDFGTHVDMIVMFLKYALLIWIITSAVDSEKHFEWFCWTHVLGCLFLGWIAYTEHDGGRFENFGGPDISEANAGALQLVSGLFIGAGLFLLPQAWKKIASAACMPLVVNAIVLTVSRSAFLAAAAGGVVFNLFVPRHLRWIVRTLSILAAVLFVLITNPEYWMRIASIKAAGADVEGVDTGSGRLVLIRAQLEMFKAYPMGCGHRCTAVLSPLYLDERQLTGPEGQRARSSHNTVFSLLVEQGIPGVAFYILFLCWTLFGVVRLRRLTKGRDGLMPALVPSLAAFLMAMVVGDMFVDYLKAEVRIWFMSLLVVMTSIAMRNAQGDATPSSKSVISRKGRSDRRPAT